VKRRIRELGLDTSHFRIERKRLQRPWSEDSLRAAIRDATSYGTALKKLGHEQVSGLHQQLRRDVIRLHLDTTHFTYSAHDRRGVGRRWSDDQLRAAVPASKSVAQVLRHLGLIAAGGNYEQVQRRIRELELDTTHFTGMGWNVGMKFRPNPPRSLDEMLVANRLTSSHSLKQRLIRSGLKQTKCERCGWAECSADGRIPIELDHINGDKTDNRIENLRILCPNCHALQLTHRGLNKKSCRR
jgi:hypothetical protein